MIPKHVTRQRRINCTAETVIKIPECQTKQQAASASGASCLLTQRLEIEEAPYEDHHDQWHVHKLLQSAGQ